MKLKLRIVLFTIIFACYSDLISQVQSDEELLNMSLDELLEIDVVNVSKLNLANLSEVPSAVTIVTQEQIESSGAKSMEEIMRMIPGFDVLRTGFNPSTNFGVRGQYSTEGTNNKILFLINDHPVRSVLLNDASVFFGNYPVESIKQIEVIRGPGSTLFGAGAFLGVVNVRTKESDRNGALSASYGSFNTTELNGMYTFRKGDDLSVTLNTNFMDTDGADADILSDAVLEYFDPAVAAFSESLGSLIGNEYDGSSGSIVPAKLNYARTTSNINLKSQYKDFFLNGGFSASEDEVPIGILFETFVEGSKIDNSFAYLEGGYKKKLLKEKGEMLLKGYYDRFLYDSDVELTPAETTPLLDYFQEISYPFIPTDADGLPNGLFNGEAFTQRKKAINEIYGAELNFAYNFGNYVNLLVGGMYEENSVSDIDTRSNGNYTLNTVVIGDTPYLFYESFGEELDLDGIIPWMENQERTVYAGFGQAEFNFKNILKLRSFDHLQVTAGVRYDEYSDVGGELNPRVGLVAAPTEKIYVKGLYGRAFRAPSFTELYAINAEFTNGNPSLNPEIINTYEGVLGYKVNNQFDANMTYFHTRINDNIGVVDNTNAETGFFEYLYENIGDIESSGLEFELTYKPEKKGYYAVSLTLQEVKDVSKNQIIATNFLTNEVIDLGSQIEFDPGIAPDLVLNFRGNYPVNDNFSINLSVNHAAERKRSTALTAEYDESLLVPTGNLVPLDTREAIPARTIVDATLNIQKLKFLPNLSIQLSGYNLLDEVNDNPTLSIRQDDLLREGINFRTRFIYSF